MVLRGPFNEEMQCSELWMLFLRFPHFVRSWNFGDFPWVRHSFHENTHGQTFCDLHTHLHLFYLISHAIRPARWNFLLLYSVILVHSLINPFLQTYVRLSPSDMRDFSLRDLHTFYLPPYVSIMVRK